MTNRSTGPACGTNPNHRMSDGDRQAVTNFKARLALQADAKPYIDRAVWVDGDPLMEVIAVTLWERCARDDQEMPQAVCDDPRTIAAFAAAVVQAYTEGRTRADRAALRDRIAEAALAAVEAALGDTLVPAAREEALAGIAAVLPPPADRAAVYAEVAERLAADAEQGDKEGLTRIYRRSAAKQVREWAAKLRRVADETPDAEQPTVLHAIPLPGSNGISACCGRPPCEFVGEHVTRDPDKVTCTGGVAGADQPATDEPERCAHCTHPKGDHDGRADHRAKHSLLVAGEPWCHACNAQCDYAATEAQPESCAHCGQPISRVTGTLTAWWVHHPGGNTVCDWARAAASTRATPATAVQQQDKEA